MYVNKPGKKRAFTLIWFILKCFAPHLIVGKIILYIISIIINVHMGLKMLKQRILCVWFRYRLFASAKHKLLNQIVCRTYFAIIIVSLFIQFCCCCYFLIKWLLKMFLVYGIGKMKNDMLWWWTCYIHSKYYSIMSHSQPTSQIWWLIYSSIEAISLLRYGLTFLYKHCFREKISKAKVV